MYPASRFGSIRSLILAPFSNERFKTLQQFGGVVYESWLESNGLQDPQDLGRHFALDHFVSVVVEADFLFAETFYAAPALKIVGTCRSEVNQIHVDAATGRGAAVINTPGRNASAVAELTVGLMFRLVKRIPQANCYVMECGWNSPAAPQAGHQCTRLLKRSRRGPTAGTM